MQLFFRTATLGIALLYATGTIAQLRVSELRTEHMVNPTCIDAPAPRFSWINNAVKPDAKGERQTAYEIAVATNERDLRKGNYNVWRSGKVVSNESNLIGYAGAELRSGRDYWWKVRVWNADDKVSPWSEPAKWGMGILNKNEWAAHWIQPQGIKRKQAPLIRKTFNLSKRVKQAKAFVSGLGYFEFYVNGQRVGDDYFVPNFTNYTTRADLTTRPGITIDDNFTAYRVLYMAYDVTAMLNKGTNVIGTILGDGFYRCDSHWVSAFGEPCMICQLEITYTDGTCERIVSDRSWEARPSAILMNGVYDGEIYDARQATTDWATVTCTRNDWTHVKEIDGPIGELTAQASPSDKITETLAPVSLRRLDNGSYEVDFGKEISGWVRLKNIVGHSGDTVVVKYISESPLGIQHYICRGDSKGETYAPRFTWYVFSKAIVSGVTNLQARQLQAEAVNTDVPICADFRTSNPLFNTINDIWRRSQIDNMHGCIASDCPHRERSPYTGDGQAVSETVMMNFDAAAFYQKWIRDMRDAQNKLTGYEPNGAPWQPGCGGGVAWGAAMTVMPWYYYLQYGDRQMLETSFDAMLAQTRYMTQWTTEAGIMNQQKPVVGQKTAYSWLNLGDWAPAHQLPNAAVVHTFYMWLCADFTSRAAQILGRHTEAEEMRTLAEKTREAFHRTFYNSAEKTYGPWGENIFALYMGGMSPERQAETTETFRHEITETHRCHLYTGYLGTKFLLETLARLGMNDIAYEVMNQRDFPSFGHWITQGATTTWEQWNGNDSHNHPFQGSCLTWFYRTLAGIQADEHAPGFRHTIIQPVFASKLDSVSYALRTPYGRLSSEVVRTPNGHTLTVEIPVGCSATILLPSGKSLEAHHGRHIYYLKE